MTADCIRHAVLDTYCEIYFSFFVFGRKWQVFFVFVCFWVEKENLFFGYFYFTAEKVKFIFGRPLLRGAGNGWQKTDTQTHGAEDIQRVLNVGPQRARRMNNWWWRWHLDCCCCCCWWCGSAPRGDQVWNAHAHPVSAPAGDSMFYHIDNNW